jgi:hypothetical protein
MVTPQKKINKAPIKLGNSQPNPCHTCVIETASAYLPFIQVTTDKIARILKNKNINTILTPYQTLRNFLKPVKPSAPSKPKVSMKCLVPVV